MLFMYFPIFIQLLCRLLLKLFHSAFRTLRFLRFARLHLMYSVLLLAGIFFTFVDVTNLEYKK